MSRRGSSRAPVAEEPLAGSYFVSAYPPFSQWKAALIGSYAAHLDRPPSTGDVPLGLYVHIPFCVRRCHYCYYLSYAGATDERVDSYLDAILAEAARYADSAVIAKRPLRFAYFGGGTPSLLSPTGIRRLLGGLRENFSWTQIEEVSFECAPQSVSADKLEALHEQGVTRVSLGVQSLDDRVLGLSGRVHRVSDVERAYRLIRQRDFEVVNLDLMVGLVGESDASFARSLERVIDMAPESVTIYQLEIPLNTPLYRALRAGRVDPPCSWSAKRQRLAWAFERLEEAGYGIRSAYTAARPEHQRFVYQDELYRGADLIGLGASAFSYLAGFHQQNLAVLSAYLDAVQAGHLPLARAYALSQSERLTRELVLQLKLGTVQLDHFRDKYQVELVDYFTAPLDRFVAEGWLTVDDRVIMLTREGLLRADRLLEAFYMTPHQAVRYS